MDVVADSAVPGPREPEGGEPEGGEPAGPDVRFRSAPLSRPGTLLGLDLDLYDGVVVLGPDRGDGPGHPDDWTLVTLLAVRLLEQRTGRETRVVTELVDDRNRPLAPVNSGSDVIVSGMLVGLLMAQIAQNRHLAPVFEELFSAEGNDVCLRPAGAYIHPGAEATFAAVVAAARDRGECAIGYRRHDVARTGSGDHGIRLNPPKGERRVWYAEDQVVVIARNTTTCPRSPPARTDPPPRPLRASAFRSDRAGLAGPARSGRGPSGPPPSRRTRTGRPGSGSGPHPRHAPPRRTSRPCSAGSG